MLALKTNTVHASDLLLLLGSRSNRCRVTRDHAEPKCLSEERVE